MTSFFTQHMSAIQAAKAVAKKTVAVFAALVMLEIIIMISPFALYWYSLYSPTLQALHGWSGTAWLASFVLPHSVITTSTILELFRWVVGPYLFSLGLLGFFVSAAQVYTAKARRKGLVTSGVYRYIRHPQYLSLGIAGLGLLTHWPRMIIVVFYFLMLVAYYFLARSEERRLLAQHPEYAEYMRQTAMFLLGNSGGHLFQILYRRVRSEPLARALVLAALFGIGLAAGFALRAYTLASAEKIVIAEANLLVIPGWPQGAAKVEQLARLALGQQVLRDRLAAEGAGGYTAHLLPADYGMMNMFTDLQARRSPWSRERWIRFGKILFEFLVPFAASHVKTEIMGNPTPQYRLVVSRVDGPGNTPLPFSRVTEAGAKMTAVAVVDLDGASHQITNMILDPPRRSFWGDIAMPMF
jgi:protein-S-isoprenylcysteine O-methyltransferase Ste14